MSEVESKKKRSQQREKQEEYTPQLVWYQRDAAASDVLESFWSPRKTSNSSVFSAEGWRKHHKDFDIFYVLMNKTDITAEDRENVHFLQHDDTEADFSKGASFEMDWNAKRSSVRAWLSYLHDLRIFYTILLRYLDGQRQPQAQYLTHSFRGTRN